MTAHEIIDGMQKHRHTVDEFLLLDREGAFGWNRTELFGGEIFYMSPKYRPHSRGVTDLAFALKDALGRLKSNLAVLLDVSIHLSDYDAPEPDIVLTDQPDGEGILPLAAARVVIEVSSTTQKIDLGPKAELYASAGIAEYWVLDVTVGILHQMWSPADKIYTQHRQIRAGEMVVAETVTGLTVELPS
jgi:Uma2 family endonuclease